MRRYPFTSFKVAKFVEYHIIKWPNGIYSCLIHQQLACRHVFTVQLGERHFTCITYVSFSNILLHIHINFHLFPCTYGSFLILTVFLLGVAAFMSQFNFCLASGRNNIRSFNVLRICEGIFRRYVKVRAKNRCEKIDSATFNSLCTFYRPNAMPNEKILLHKTDSL